MGNVPKILTDAFYLKDQKSLLSFFVNDLVIVKSGEHSGKRAWVISLEHIEPEQHYLVEFEDGGDAVLPVSKISRFNSSNQGQSAG